MKIKSDFVTNSSSVGFIIYVPSKEDIQDVTSIVEKINKLPVASNEGARVNFVGSTIEELNTYTQGRPWDWASEPRGLDYFNLSEKHYKECKKTITEHNHTIMIVTIDNNAYHYFEERYDRYIVASHSF